MPRLRRTSQNEPGWTRRRAGKGFVYLDEHGDAAGADDVQRCKDLVIPPAWEDVWICPYPRGHLQAVGTDDAGRRQYLYHPALATGRDDAKFVRILDFGKALSKARERVAADLGTEGMTRERGCAVAVRLLDLGYFRIGNDVYADENGSFGLTTLERRHVRVAAGLVFDFDGKSGVEHRIEIDDEATIEALEVMRAPAWRRATGCSPTRTGVVARPRLRAGQRLHPRVDRASTRPPRTSGPGTRPSWPPPPSPTPTSRARRRRRGSAPSGDDEGGRRSSSATRPRWPGRRTSTRA